MPYRNTYTPTRALAEAAYHASTRLEDYDLNWVYGSVPPLLETPGGVRLVPLIPSIHAERLYNLYSNHTDSYAYLPYGPFETYQAFLTKLELARRDRNTLLFAVYDLALTFDEDDDSETENFELEAGQGLRKERLAGIVGVKESNSQNRMTEIGHVHIPPPFQRTHVATHSIALLLYWTLDPPDPRSHPHNLGLRRVQWFANPSNLASVVAAQKLGMKLEAPEIRWERTLPPRRGKVSLELPDFVKRHERRHELEEERGGARHSTLLSLDWETWETTSSAPRQGRRYVDELLKRPVRTRHVRDVKGLGLVAATPI